MPDDLTFKIRILHIGVRNDSGRIYGKGVVTKGLKDFFKVQDTLLFTTLINDQNQESPMMSHCIATAGKKDVVIENKELTAILTFLSPQLRTEFIQRYSTSRLGIEMFACGEIDKCRRVQNLEIKYIFVDCLEEDPIVLEDKHE